MYADPAFGISPANSAYDSAAQALARPAIRNDTSTAGPAVPLATVPASVKMPAPMMPPTPIAVSCHSPSDLSSRGPSAISVSSMCSMGLRRRIPSPARSLAMRLTSSPTANG